MVIVFNYSILDDKLSIDPIKESLFNEESKRNQLGFSMWSKAIVTNERGRNKTRASQNSNNRRKSIDRSMSRKSIIYCYYGKPNHIKSAITGKKRNYEINMMIRRQRQL